MMRLTRRSLLIAGVGATRLRGAGRSSAFPGDVERYADPLTSLEVYRLTSPEYSTTLTAYYNRGIARNSSWMLCCCDRTGSPQGFRLDLKTGEMKQLTDTRELDGTTLTLTPDNRSLCYFAGRSLFVTLLTSGRERE